MGACERRRGCLTCREGIEKPHAPVVQEMFTADGQLDDMRMCRVAMTNASLFAYVADGRNGLRVVQLTAPERVPEYGGFSPATPGGTASFPSPSVTHVAWARRNPSARNEIRRRVPSPQRRES